MQQQGVRSPPKIVHEVNERASQKLISRIEKVSGKPHHLSIQNLQVKSTGKFTEFLWRVGKLTTCYNAHLHPCQRSLEFQSPRPPTEREMEVDWKPRIMGGAKRVITEHLLFGVATGTTRTKPTSKAWNLSFLKRSVPKTYVFALGLRWRSKTRVCFRQEGPWWKPQKRFLLMGLAW